MIATIRREDTLVWEADIPANARLRVDKGDEVRAGDQLTEGAKNPKEILRIQGREACQIYLLEEVQKVYRSQGVSIHDKHIEVILRQLLRRILVRATGDTELLPGELIDRFEFEDINADIVAKGGKPARGEPVVLGSDQGGAEHGELPGGCQLPGDDPCADRGGDPWPAR